MTLSNINPESTDNTTSDPTPLSDQIFKNEPAEDDEKVVIFGTFFVIEDDTMEGAGVYAFISPAPQDSFSEEPTT